MRKLATAALGLSAAIATAQYLVPSDWLLPVGAVISVFIIFALFLRGSLRTRLLLISVFAAAGMFWSWGHYQLFIAPAQELAGKELTVTGRVVEFTEAFENYNRIYLKLTGADLPNIKVALYSYDSSMPELTPGDLISCKVQTSSALTRYGTKTDIYTSDGIFLTAELNGEINITGRSALSFLYFPKTVGRAMRASVESAFSSDVMPFMKALLTGDKKDLYSDGDLYSGMGTAGLMHTVAISGMHVAFLIGFVRQFSRRRRMTAFIGIPLILFFIVMTGGSPSVIRAGFMQLTLLVAPLLKRENDSITSLSAVLAALLIVNPASAASVGLQLSFAAMAGIITVTPKIYDALIDLSSKTKLPDIRLLSILYRFLISSFSGTIGALVFSVPLSALHFGYVSLVAPFTNILCLWAVSISFTAGYIVCIINMIVPVIGAAAGWLLAWLPRYIIFIVRALSKLPHAAIYTGNNYFAWWLVLAYAVFIITYAAKGARRYRPAVPICLCVLSLCAAFLISSVFWGTGGKFITAIDVGQGQSVAVISGSGTVLIDCGGNGGENAGDTAADYLLGLGRQGVDLFVLTHLHEDHAGGVVRLLDRMDIGTLVMPRDTDDSDGLMEDILTAAGKTGTDVSFITENAVMSCGEITLEINAPLGGASDNERGLIVLARIADYEALITGDAGSLTEWLYLEKRGSLDIELLMVGHHGSRYSTGIDLLRETRPEIAVISVGRNSYGHPTGEVLERLDQFGADVFRTDLMGNITVRIK